MEDYNREVREDDEARRSSTERWDATGGRIRLGGKGQGVCDSGVAVYTQGMQSRLTFDVRVWERNKRAEEGGIQN